MNENNINSYSVPFRIEGFVKIYIEDCWDEEVGIDAIHDALSVINYGKLTDIEDFANSTSEYQDILYDVLDWNEEKGEGVGYQGIVASLTIDVEAKTFEEALSIANEKYKEMIKTEDTEIFGEVQDIRLESEPTIQNVFKNEKVTSNKNEMELVNKREKQNEVNKTNKDIYERN